MHVNGPSHVHGPHGLNGPHHPRIFRPTDESKPAGPANDQLEISAAAEAAIVAAEDGDVRSELVAQIRSEIAAGTYETPEKLDLALERLLDEIG